MSADAGADKPPLEMGDVVYLGDALANVVFTGVVQGPPGPPGPVGEISLHTNYGAREEPALSFVVGGWEYSFPSKELARQVREKLISMTLEGEL